MEANTTITKGNFSIDEIVRKMKKPEIGAAVTFSGVMRADGGMKGMGVEVHKGCTGRWRCKSWRS